MDLLRQLSYEFAITTHVEEEISDHYREQKQRLSEATITGLCQSSRLIGRMNCPYLLRSQHLVGLALVSVLQLPLRLVVAMT